MDTSELLKRAWKAVEDSGVPESLHEVAFREAVEDLRASEGSSSDGPPSAARKPAAKSKAAKAAPAGTPAPNVDEATFFANLAHEAEVPETDLRDVLSLAEDGTVHVTKPQKALGTSTAQQARTIIALVASARAFGLGERPINAAAVRDEVKRRHSYDTANYAAKGLGGLEGFNPGGKPSELVTTSKWHGEFVAALNQALGRKDKDKN